MEPIVSVVMISYNHEKYIKEAILNILNQECSFSYELVISDDCSKDNTVAEIEHIIETNKNGNAIRLIKQNPNLGMMQNFGFALKEAKGKYIAICEGDDYWTNPKKLQQQYDILESNDSCVLSFHNATIVNEFDQSSKPFNTYSKEFYSSDEQFDQWLIPTASSFFRNVLPETLPPFLQKGTHGDLALFLLLGEHGTFHYTNEIMSVYRINDTGVTQNVFKGIQHNLEHIEQLEKMQEYFGDTHCAALDYRKSNYLLSNAILFAQNGEKLKAKKSLRKALSITPSFRFKKALTIIRIFIKTSFG